VDWANAALDTTMARAAVRMTRKNEKTMLRFKENLLKGLR
jgi:hypothetical protein